MNEQKAYIQLYRIENMLIISGSELQGTVQEVENLRKEVDKLKQCGETDTGCELKNCHSVCEVNTSHIVSLEILFHCSKILAGWRVVKVGG